MQIAVHDVALCNVHPRQNQRGSLVIESNVLSFLSGSSCLAWASALKSQLNTISPSGHSETFLRYHNHSTVKRWMKALCSRLNWVWGLICIQISATSFRLVKTLIQDICNYILARQNERYRYLQFQISLIKIHLKISIT